MEVVNSLLIFHAAERSPRPLTRTQMVRTELAKTRPRAGKADITRQVEMIASMDFQEGPLNADTLTLATGVPPVSQCMPSAWKKAAIGKLIRLLARSRQWAGHWN